MVLLQRKDYVSNYRGWHLIIHTILGNLTQYVHVSSKTSRDPHQTNQWGWNEGKLLFMPIIIMSTTVLVVQVVFPVAAIPHKTESWKSIGFCKLSFKFLRNVTSYMRVLASFLLSGKYKCVIPSKWASQTIKYSDLYGHNGMCLINVNIKSSKMWNTTYHTQLDSSRMA